MSLRLRLVIAVVGALALLVAVGRIEAGRDARTQNQAFRRLLAVVGPRWSTTAATLRLTPTFDCLLYRFDGNPYAVELCFDAAGRIVEAADRRGGSAMFWTLRFEPGASTVAVDRAQLVAAFVRFHAAPIGATSIPLGQYDRGPIPPQLLPKTKNAPRRAG